MIPLRQRRRFAWFALFAILLNAFTPAMSRALEARLGVSFLEICTKDGLKRVAVRYEGARPDLPPGAHGAIADHCAFCAPHGASAAPVPTRGWNIALIAGPASLPSAAPAGAPQRAQGTHGYARAPPAFS